MLACAAALVLAPSLATAAEPKPLFELERPPMLAYVPGPAAMIAPPPVLAKRASERKFDTSLGERDPRLRQRPRTHRFRLAIHAQHITLPRAVDEDGNSQRFHFAPMMLDLAYQAQFLKFVMVRLAVAAGYNVANSRNAMPGVVYPQIYAGYQGKIVGAALGYGFIWTIPPTFDAVDPQNPNGFQQPVITRNHVVMGELSATSKIDRVALTFSLALGGVQSDLSHYDAVSRKWRFYLGLQLGMYFDGTIRRERKARKKAEAEGR
jgi:hypothetical protein